MLRKNTLFRKKAFILLLLLFLVAAVYYGIAAAKGPAKGLPVRVLVNGREVDFPDATPFLDEHNRVQAPVRFVARELGARVNWDAASATASLNGHGKSIALVPGRDTATVNQAEVQLDSGPVLIEDRIFVPVRFIAETLGAAVQWNQNAKTVQINMGLPVFGSGQDKIGLGELLLTGYNHDLQFAPGRQAAVFSGYHYPAGGDGGVSSKLLLLDLAQNTITILDEGEFFRALGWDARGENVLYMKDSSLYRLSLREGKKNLIAEDCHYGSFSPDGRRVAYVQRNTGLWVSDPDGANRKRLTAATGDWYPVWYPDDRHLFFFNDLGQELGDGAGHLQGMAKISVADGTVERILPQKTGKFRSAEWIVPGRSLHVISGWDDGFYQHIVDLAGEKITDLGENFGSLNYAVAIDTAGGRLVKISADGEVQILDAAGQLQKSFDLNQDGRVCLSAACAPDGRNLLLMSGKQPGGEGPEEKRISVLDVANGSLRTLAEGGANYEACFWAPGYDQILILEKKDSGSSAMFSGFTIIPAGLPGRGEGLIFTPVQESALSDEQKAFVEEVKELKGIHRKDDLYVIALGEKPNPGYGLEMVKTEMSREQGRVYIKLTKPDPGRFYAAVITYPYLVGKVNLPRDAAVSFINIETGAFLDLNF